MHALVKDVDKAVRAAHDAFDSWSKISKEERADYLLEISRRIHEKTEHLATVESLQNGKPIVKHQQLMYHKQPINLSILLVF